MTIPAEHPRTEVRKAAQAMLLGNTAAGDRVYRTRVVPLRKQELPVIVVYCSGEAIDAEWRQSYPRQLRREIELVVEGWVQVADDRADDALDALALEIEAALGADTSLQGAATDSILLGTELVTGSEGDREMGIITLRYRVDHQDDAPTPDVAVDDFLVAGATYDLAGAQAPADQVQDEFEVRP